MAMVVAGVMVADAVGLTGVVIFLQHIGDGGIDGYFATIFVVGIVRPASRYVSFAGKHSRQSYNTP